MSYELHRGDCLQIMPTLPDGCVDMILADLPYGTTACSWDSVIPFEPLWKQYKRLIKPRGAIVLFGSQPFTSALVMSNPKWFKYCWVWEKTIATNFMMQKFQPAKKHEDIAVFYDMQPTYNPQMQDGKSYTDKRACSNKKIGFADTNTSKRIPIFNGGERFPSTVQIFSNGNNETIHPTQKPINLLAYLIRTYTNEGETVLDNTMGSGSTGVAAIQEGRRFIGIEQDENYFAIAEERIRKATFQPSLFAAPVQQWQPVQMFAAD